MRKVGLKRGLVIVLLLYLLNNSDLEGIFHTWGRNVHVQTAVINTFWK